MEFPAKDSLYDLNVQMNFCTWLSKESELAFLLFILILYPILFPPTPCLSYSIDVSIYDRQKRTGQEGRVWFKYNSNPQVKSEAEI